ncbi:hypothetical protein CRG98_010164 [Punica granatum]|uniref:Aspartic peptidase DDI1-type domain-containing protein n=1 Tax=Punica granatum TaxID=22663 RepID=A0A2I0KLT4_PUNGR|nr:hypothetical protein CRG98_010164 [Punica granatum]
MNCHPYSPLHPCPSLDPTISTPGFKSCSAGTVGLSTSVVQGHNFDPTNQDPSRRYEYHIGAPVIPLTTAGGYGKRSSSGPSINMISICTVGYDESMQEDPLYFVIEYVPTEVTIGFTGFGIAPTSFVIEFPTREPYQDSKVPWAYEGSVGNLEQQFSIMGMMRSGWVYENPKAASKGKVLVSAFETVPKATPILQKKVNEEEAKAFMKIIKAPKEKASTRIEETVGPIFSNNISFSDDELPSEGYAHSGALHIICKCNNFVVGRVMIDNGSALNVCPISTLKQMNVELNRIRPSKTAVRSFDGSRREVNGEIDVLIDVDPCSFIVTFQVLDILNAFSLLLRRPWFHSAGIVPFSLHERLKFVVEDWLVMVMGEEDYAIYKETVVPYINIGDDENLPFN